MDISPKKIYRWQIKMKKCSTSCVIRELQIKTIIRYSDMLIRMTEIQHTGHTRCRQECGVTGALVHCGWECKMIQTVWKTGWQFLQSYTYSHHIIQLSCSLVFTQTS